MKHYLVTFAETLREDLPMPEAMEEATKNLNTRLNEWEEAHSDVTAYAPLVTFDIPNKVAVVSISATKCIPHIPVQSSDIVFPICGCSE